MDIRVDLDAAGCVFLALLILAIPVPWVLSALTAAVIHELGHILSVYMTGGRILSLKIRCFGAVLQSSPMTPGRELLCILAGPAASLLLLSAGRILPRMALCGLIQGCFNLIPAEPLDGGRALACLLGMVFPVETADKICKAVKWSLFIMLFAGGIWGFLGMNLGFGPVILALFLLYRIRAGKIPCKDGPFAVQ